MADDFCPRQIVFSIPGSPGVQITATERNGAIDFVVDVQNSAKLTADLRGLFFDIAPSKLVGLTVIGGTAVTETRVKADSVLDLGNGANMNGATKAGFDVGIEFGTEGIGKDDIDIGRFTLTNSAGNLTLDDIATQRFGARLTSVGAPGGNRNDSLKLLGSAPFAPDARDDSYTIFEDNGTGLASPTKSVTPVTLKVLSNDIDGDGQAVFITSIHQQPAHGSITIAADGKSLLYTPQQDYSGTVTVEYCISDGNGGQDSATATINLTPVADIPLLGYTLAGTANVNEILITVTANQNDADSSEYIDSIVSSALPAGVTLSPVTWNPDAQLDTVSHQFLLTLPLGQDADFDLSFTALSVETANGDTQTASVTVPISFDYKQAIANAQFTATDQSIWGNGDAFNFVDDRFIGIDETFSERTGETFYAGVSGNLKLGFQSTLTFNGGNIDAAADYRITVDSNYNKTLDTLRLDIASALTNVSFDTVGPEGSYVLQFVYDVLINAYAGISGLGQIDVPAVDIGPGSFDLINLQSTEIGGSITLPKPLEFLSINLDWPNITTAGSGTSSPVTSSGQSDNFLELVLDLDDLVTKIVKIPNVFDPPPIEVFPVKADPDLLDVDITGGLNFIQDFTLAMGNLVGTLIFEDGSSRAFDFGVSNLQIDDASEIDAGGDNDGFVDFTLNIAPAATLSNSTDLGFNIGFSVKMLSVTISDIGGILGSTTLGPLVNEGITFPVADVEIYDASFALNFAANSYTFSI